MSLGKPVSFLEITIPYSANVLLQRLIKVKYVKKKNLPWCFHDKVINIAYPIL